MKTLAWFVVLGLNVAGVLAFAPSVWAAEVPAYLRAFGAIASAIFAAICTLLVVSRMRPVPARSRAAMKILCGAVPVTWLLGSLDNGTISGLEGLSVLFAALLAWATWRAFLLHVPNPEFVRDAGARAMD